MHVTVTLACGDQVTAKNPPLHPKAKYICPANRGCGYQIPWVRYHNTHGYTQINTQTGAQP